MMKFVYIALIPILAVLIVIYLIILLSYHPPAIDKNTTGLTDTLIKNSPVLNIQELAAYKDTFKQAMPSDIWENNLFDPSREGAISVSGSEGLKNVELVGVFSNGNVKGAIILLKTGESHTTSGYGSGSTYGGYGSSSSRGSSSRSGSLGAQKQQERPPVKAVFKVGDRLPNGLTLESVGSDFVMLRGGKESVKLKMAILDENSEKRVAETSKGNVKPPVTIISATQGATGVHGGQTGIGSPPAVTPSHGTGGSNVQSQGIFQGYGR